VNKNTENVTIADVARQAGVSATTVSRVLNPAGAKGLPISEATRGRIMAAADQLNFVSRAHARLLRQQKSPMIGFLIEGMVGPFTPPLVNELCLRLARMGKQLVLGIYGSDIEIARQHVRTFRSYRTAAVLVRSRLGTVEDEIHEALLAGAHECGPFIFIAGRESRPGVTYVCHDFEAVLENIFRLAETHGPRRILLAGGSTAMARATEADFLRHAQRHPRLEVHTLSVPTERFYEDVGPATIVEARRLLADGPLLVLAGDDRAAFEIATAARQAGVGVPAPLAIIGRGNTELAEVCRPTLTSVDILGNTPALADEVIRLLTLWEQGSPVEPRVHSIGPPNLVLRQSYAPFGPAIGQGERTEDTACSSAQHAAESAEPPPPSATMDQAR